MTADEIASMLASHLANWLGNTRHDDARSLAEALIDPTQRGPLADPEVIVKLVALMDARGIAWPDDTATEPQPGLALVPPMDRGLR